LKRRSSSCRYGYQTNRGSWHSPRHLLRLSPRISSRIPIQGSRGRLGKLYGSFCMIDVPDLGQGFLEMWQELLLLAKRPPAPWTLIGAHMVALSQTLLSRGFSLDGISPEGIGHRFVNGRVRLDVLGPDGLGGRNRLHTVSGARTVEVPGGSQALTRTPSGKAPAPSKPAPRAGHAHALSPF
jgi:hypothetical protein